MSLNILILLLTIEYIVNLLLSIQLVRRVRDIYHFRINAYENILYGIFAITSVIFFGFLNLYIELRVETVLFELIAFNTFILLRKFDGVMLIEEVVLIVMVIGCGFLLIMENNMVYIYIYIELVNLSTIFLILLNRVDNIIEATIKYILVSVVSSIAILTGICCLYWVRGCLLLNNSQASFIETANYWIDFCILAVLIISCGIKLGLAPFHGILMDIYGAIKNHSLIYMISLNKAIFLILLIKFVYIAHSINAFGIIGILGLFTIFVGCIGSFYQNKLNLFLGYTSLVMMGLIMLILCAFQENGSTYILSMFTIYILIVMGLIYLLIDIFMFHNTRLIWDVTHLSGIFVYRPIWSAVVALIIFSLMGVPPLAGFIYKLIPFSILLESGYILIAAFSLVVGVFSAYYYLRILAKMFFDDSRNSSRWNILIFDSKKKIFEYAVILILNITILLLITDICSDYTMMLMGVAYARKK